MLIIFCINVIAELPEAALALWRTKVFTSGADPLEPLQMVFYIALLAMNTTMIIALSQSQRRIQIQYAKRVVGRKVYGGQTEYLPIKINHAGVLPIVAAHFLVLLLANIILWIWPVHPWASTLAEWLLYGNLFYVAAIPLVFLYTYFFRIKLIDSKEIAESLKKNGAYIPVSGHPKPATREHFKTRHLGQQKRHGLSP